jgi:outer membrane usher protein
MIAACPVLCACCSLMLLAGPLQGMEASAAVQPQAADILLLDVTVNTRALDDIVRIYKFADGHLAMSVEEWVEARLKPAGNKLLLPDGRQGYALDAVKGLHYKFDSAKLSLDITAPPAAFDASILDGGRGGAGIPNLAPPGLYVNYDLTGTRAAASLDSYGGLIEGVAFNRWGSAVTGVALRDDQSALETTRTETYFEKDLPSSMGSLVLGDTTSSDGGWSRSARYGGIRFARDFELRPGYITFPIPSLSGSAALPSVVDVLVNNQRQVSGQPVAAGPFTLNNIPLVTGAGDINLVVRDLRGVETVFTQSFYTAPHLLEAGLSDFSLEAGRLRYNFGVESNDYGPAFAAGTYRYGLSQAFTGETRIEAQKDRSAGGIEIDGLIGTYASFRAAASESVASGEYGGHDLLGLERITQFGAVSVQWDHFDSGYVAFAALPDESRPHEQITGGFGMKLSARLSAAANYTSQSSWNAARFRSTSVNVSLSLPGNVYISTYAIKRLDTDAGWSGAINLLVALGHLRTATASIERDQTGHLLDTAEVQQSAPQGPGLGWSVRTSNDPTQRLQSGLTLNTNDGTFTADLNEGKNTDAVRLGASGSIGLLEGLPFATRSIGEGSFAVVKVGDLADVQVYRSNQVVATTNSRGLALVPFLLPYQENQITIDPEKLPLDAEIHAVKVLPVPYARSGLFVKFDVARSRSALVILRQSLGTPVPAGARVTIGDNPGEFIVALRGEVYLTGVRDKNSLAVHWKDHSCLVALSVAPAAPRGETPRIGPLACAEQHD